jgi:Zn-finger nucleic acid-binding protein
MKDEHLVLKRKSTKEDEYFARQDKELIARHREEKARREAEKAKEEAARRREIHYMKCPKCGSDMEEIEFKEIQIDRCTGCSGVWLDKGELKTLLEREARMVKTIFKAFFSDKDFEKLD